MTASFACPPPISQANSHLASDNPRNGCGQDGDADLVNKLVQQHQESLFRQSLWLMENESAAPARSPNGKLL